MIGIPLGLLAANATEWVVHKYVLHGLGKKKSSFWSFHWHEHHAESRTNVMRDPHYADRSVLGWHAQGKEALPARILKRMADLVRCDRHRRQRSAIVMLLQQANRLGLRIVMVAEIGFLDGNRFQPEAIEEMARQLTTGTGKIRPVGAVLFDDPAHNKLREERYRQKKRDAEDYQHRTSFRSGSAWIS